MTKTPLHTAFALVPPGAPRRGAFGLLLMLAVVGWPQAAEAQLDPLLLLKRSLPSITTPQYRANVLVAVDVAPRMQYDADGNYYDPTEYVRGNLWDTALGVTAGNTTARFRRIYQGLQWSASAPQKFNATTHLDRRRRGEHAVHPLLPEDPARRRQDRARPGDPREHHLGAVRPAQDAPDQPARRVARRRPRVRLRPRPAAADRRRRGGLCGSCSAVSSTATTAASRRRRRRWSARTAPTRTRRSRRFWRSRFPRRRP